jgi:hypothetical protein
MSILNNRKAVAANSFLSFRCTELHSFRAVCPVTSHGFHPQLATLPIHCKAKG